MTQTYKRIKRTMRRVRNTASTTCATPSVTKISAIVNPRIYIPIYQTDTHIVNEGGSRSWAFHSPHLDVIAEAAHTRRSNRFHQEDQKTTGPSPSTCNSASTEKMTANTTVDQTTSGER